MLVFLGGAIDPVHGRGLHNLDIFRDVVMDGLGLDRLGAADAETSDRQLTCCIDCDTVEARRH